MSKRVQWRPEHGDSADLRLDPDYRSGCRVLPGGRFAVYSRGRQDCMRAAVATALGVRYDATPAEPSEEMVRRRFQRRSSFGFWDAWNAWAAERGLVACLHWQTPPLDRPWWIGREIDVPTAGFAEGHALVMRHDTLVLDPSLIAHNTRVLNSGLTFDPEYVDGQPVAEWLAERVAESQRRSREHTERERSNQR